MFPSQNLIFISIGSLFKFTQRNTNYLVKIHIIDTVTLKGTSIGETLMLCLRQLHSEEQVTREGCENSWNLAHSTIEGFNSNMFKLPILASPKIELTSIRGRRLFYSPSHKIVLCYSGTTFRYRCPSIHSFTLVSIEHKNTEKCVGVPTQLGNWPTVGTFEHFTCKNHNQEESCAILNVK